MPRLQAYGYSFAAMVLADVLFWSWYRCFQHSREAAVTASGLGNWGPLKVVIAKMNRANILMCVLITAIAVIAENASEKSLPPFGETRVVAVGEGGRVLLPPSSRIVEYNAVCIVLRHLWASSVTLCGIAHWGHGFFGSIQLSKP